MDKCPICKTKIDEKKDYCPTCAWEFEYYFDELSIEERERYKDRFKIWKSKFNGNSEPTIPKESLINEEKKIENTKKYRMLISIIWGFFSIYGILFLDSSDFAWSNESGAIVLASSSLFIWFLTFIIYYKQKINKIEIFIHWVVLSLNFYVLLYAFYRLDILLFFNKGQALAMGVILSIVVITIFYKEVKREK